MNGSNLIQPLKDKGEELLKQHIHADEKILAKLQGNFGQGLAVTDKRLYIIKWGAFAGSIFGGRCITFDYGRITGVKINTGMTTGTLEILTAANQDQPKSYWGQGQDNANQADDAITFGSSQFNDFREVAKICHDMIEDAKQGKLSTHSGFNDLEQLASLKEKGIITQEEFDAKKKQILGL